MFTDRYYTSLPLVRTLQAVGTSPKNSIDLPDTIRSSTFRLANDEICAFRNDRLLALEWRAAKHS